MSWLSIVLGVLIGFAVIGTLIFTFVKLRQPQAHFNRLAEQSPQLIGQDEMGRQLANAEEALHENIVFNEKIRKIQEKSGDLRQRADQPVKQFTLWKKANMS
jgi:hypothetical protein